MTILLWGSSVGIRNYLDSVGSKDVAGIVVPATRREDAGVIGPLATASGIPLYVQPLRKGKERYRRFLREVRDVEADIFLIHSYPMILGPEVLTLPSIAAFNVHGGVLPQYRGGNVLNWVLINGEKETGVTIHYVEKEIDAGDIVKQRLIPVEFEDTVVTLREKILTVAGEMLVQVMPLIAGKTNERIEQDGRLARYWPARTPGDGCFEWEWPAVRIYNMIRALVKPWPGAFYRDGAGRKVIVDSYRSLQEVKEMQKEQIGHVVE